MKTTWGWSPVPSEGIWKHGCRWAKPLTASAPWITLALLLAMFGLLEGRLTTAPGLVFDLPQPVSGESDIPGLAVVLVPVMREDSALRETLLFFDDACYSLSDENSLESFHARLRERAATDPAGALLVLADARVPAGHLMRLTGLARDAGVVRVQIAEKRE